jgi:hypothetical protein
MANFSVPAGHVGVHEKTLAASTIDTVTFTGADLTEVEVISDGTADIYVSFGATTTPTITGTMCYRVPQATGGVMVVFSVRTSGDTVVKLISDGTPVYSVSRT